MRERQRWAGHRNNVPAARVLRRPLTPAEAVLRRALRDRRMDGLKFRRQHPVGPFVLDFCCPASRLAVEVDGAVHDERAEQDAARTALLAASGYRVLRFRNEDVLGDLGTVLARIRAAIADSSGQG
jgi:very-short-patch-repair endonuclease